MLNEVLKEVNLPETARKIYLRLIENGPVSARQLAEYLGVPRPSVYDNLKILMALDLVVEHEEENKKIFAADDIQNLFRLLNEKVDSLKTKEKELKKILPKLKKEVKTFEPKIKFYSGVEGVRQVLKDLLWNENMETLTMWPISEMVDVLGKNYLTDLNRKRIRRNISIKGIWPEDKAVKLKEYPFLGIGKGHLRELRLAPKGMSWNMSYWLYGNKVAFISSHKELFGFVVNSRDFTELLKTQFEIIWRLSKPIKPQPQFTDEFLKTV